MAPIPLDIDLTEPFPALAGTVIYGKVEIAGDLYQNALVLNFSSRAALCSALNAGMVRFSLDDDSLCVVLTDF